MRRFVGSLFAICVLSGCSLSSMVPGPIDPACQAHEDPSDCQSALDVGTDGLGFDSSSYVVTVEPISCGEGQCTTWMRAVPDGDADCVPTYEVELMREAGGPWTVGMLAHGDPPCAFDP